MHVAFLSLIVTLAEMLTTEDGDDAWVRMKMRMRIKNKSSQYMIQ